MELEDWLSTSMCERFEENGVVSPVYLRNSLPESYASVPAVSLKIYMVEVQPCHMEQIEKQLAAETSQEEN